MRALTDVIRRWVCEACNHHNPKWRFECRRCRTPR